MVTSGFPRVVSALLGAASLAAGLLALLVVAAPAASAVDGISGGGLPSIPAPSSSTWQANGGASIQGDGSLQLTRPDFTLDTGTVFYKTAISKSSLTGPLRITFKVNPAATSASSIFALEEGVSVVFLDATTAGPTYMGFQAGSLGVDQSSNFTAKGAYVALDLHGDTNYCGTQNPNEQPAAFIGVGPINYCASSGTTFYTSTSSSWSARASWMSVVYDPGTGKASVAALDASGNVLGRLDNVDLPVPDSFYLGFTGQSGNYWGGGQPAQTITLSGAVPKIPAAVVSGARNAAMADSSCPCLSGDPVNTASGALTESASDVSVPGRGVGLSVDREYVSSAASTDGPFGYGWSWNWGMSTSTDASSGKVTVSQEDGAPVTFAPDGSGGFTAPGSVLASLVQNTDGSLTFTRNADHVAYTFNTSGQLVSAKDLNGNTTTLTYSGGKLSTVTDAAGRTLTFAYSGSHVTSVTDPMARTVQYGYDSTGNLTTVTDRAGRTTQYGYDSTHELATMTSPAGNATHNTYDASGRVVKQVDPTGLATTFAYTGDPDTESGGTTTVTDGHGSATAYKYQQMVMTSRTVAAGTSSAMTTTYTYDPVTWARLSQTDQLGNVTSSTYDSAGDLLTTTDPDSNTTAYAYDSLGDVTSIKDPASGKYTTFTYDSHGNLLTKTDLLGNKTMYTHGDSSHPGDVTKVTDPMNRVVSYTYDSAGDVASYSTTATTGGAAMMTQYVYDADGERVCEATPTDTDVAAAFSCPAPGSPRVPYTYVWTYNNDGQMLTTTARRDNSATTVYTYDADGNTASVTDAEARKTTYSYDGVDRAISATAGAGTKSAVTTSTTYDLAPGLKTCPTATALPGVAYCSTSMDGRSLATTTAYDARGLTLQVVRPGSMTTRYGYDRAGRQVSRTDPDGRVVSYVLDADGLTQQLTYADGSVVSYAYDADGRRTSMTDSTGTTSYTLDDAGRTTKVTDGGGNTVGYSLNADGDIAKLTYPGGQTVSYTYDGAGRETSLTMDWVSKTINFDYNDDGRLQHRVLPNGDTIYDFWFADQHVSSTLQTTSTGATLAELDYSTDETNRVTEVAASGALSGTTDYAYDPLAQLDSTTSGSSSKDYGFDGSGNLTTMAGTTQTYPTATGDELSKSVSTTGSTAYTYTADGQRATSAYTPAGSTAATVRTTESYSQAGAMTGYTSTTGSTTTSVSYGYNGDNLRVSKTTGSGTDSEVWQTANTDTPHLLTAGGFAYVYDPEGLPIAHVRLSSGSTDYYLHDQDGSTRALVKSTGAVSGTYSYTPYGVSTHTGSDATPLTYTGGYADSESGLIYLVSRYYDPSTGTFTTVDPAVDASGAPYAYAAGDPVDNTDPLGLFSLGGAVSAVWRGTTHVVSAGAHAVAHAAQQVAHAAAATSAAVARSRANPGNWNHDDWVRAGIVLGAVALAATGVGLAVDDAGVVLVLDSIADGATGAATGLDAADCIGSHAAAACGGMILGGAGFAFGAVGTVIDASGFLRAEEIAAGAEEIVDGAKILNAQAGLLGGGGLTIDGLSCLGLTGDE